MGRTTLKNDNSNRHSQLAQAKAVCRFLSGKLAKRVVLLKVPEFEYVADYFIVAGATSKIHLNALEGYLRKELKDKQIPFVKGTEGRQSASWRVVDAGFFVVHLMDDMARLRYRLEELWSNASRIFWKARSTRLKKLRPS